MPYEKKRFHKALFRDIGMVREEREIYEGLSSLTTWLPHGLLNLLNEMSDLNVFPKSNVYSDILVQFLIVCCIMLFTLVDCGKITSVTSA